MAKVIAPNKQYTGISAGVTFVNGVGETSNPELLKWFERHGYKVEKEPKAPKAPKDPKKPTNTNDDSPQGSPENPEGKQGNDDPDENEGGE